MVMLKRGLAVLVGALVGACGPAEIRIDEHKGIPPLRGGTEVSLVGFTCGQPFAAGEFQVSTRAVTEGCEFSFGQDVPLLATGDYAKITDFSSAASFVQRVELTITKLDFTDATSGAVLDLSTRFVTASLLVNGQQVADKSSLTNLPKTVTLQGDALNSIKSSVESRSAVRIGVRVLVVVPTTPPPPEKLRLDYEAQPVIVVGPGKVKLPSLP
jgi:hypothetical protein